MGEISRVCVTGAGGFVASWLVKLLLSEGYNVHGTVRNTGDEKNAHLKSLENAAEKLKLFKADLLDHNSIRAAIEGCDGVFHVASPLPSSSIRNPEVEMVAPAVEGTLNVLKACSEAKVKRVVVVSSILAMYMNPNWPKDQPMDETCWSDTEYCKRTNNWYCYAKTVAEKEALEYARKTGLDVITLCPTLVVGPMLQQTPNASSFALLHLLKGYEQLENKDEVIVDVRDVAEALKLVYEKPEAEGRYICISHIAKSQELVEILKKNYPTYKYPKSFKDGKVVPKASTQKLQNLGWKQRPLEEILVDSVETYKKVGMLDS